MEKIYVLKRDKFIKGPYTLQEIQLKGIKSTDKVWYEGIKDWTFATNIVELKDFIRTKTESSTSSSFLSRLFGR
jgi:hypothetical protein